MKTSTPPTAQQTLDDLSKKMDNLLLDGLNQSIKTTNKFMWIHYTFFISAIILGPIYLYSGNYFAGSIWTFNFFMNGYFIYLGRSRVAKAEKEKLVLRKKMDPIGYDKDVRKRKFRSLGIK